MRCSSFLTTHWKTGRCTCSFIIQLELGIFGYVRLVRLGISYLQFISHKVVFCTSQPLQYRKISNISLGLVDIFLQILGGLYSGGAYIWRAFCVRMCILKTSKSPIISIKYQHFRQKRASLQLESPSLWFETLLLSFSSCDYW